MKLDLDVDGNPLKLELEEALEEFKKLHIFVELDFMTKKRFDRITVVCDLKHCNRNFMLKNRDKHY